MSYFPSNQRSYIPGFKALGKRRKELGKALDFWNLYTSQDPQLGPSDRKAVIVSMAWPSYWGSQQLALGCSTGRKCGDFRLDSPNNNNTPCERESFYLLPSAFLVAHRKERWHTSHDNWTSSWEMNWFVGNNSSRKLPVQETSTWVERGLQGNCFP